jgi:aldose sugar dehydrogenase
VYLSYSKAGDRGATLALARGRFHDNELTDVREIFVAEAWAGTGPSSSTGGGTYGGRMLFAPDGTLLLAVGDRDTRVGGDDSQIRLRAQNLADDAGKILRLRDDGSVPADNPFVGRAGARPEVFSYGHRNPYGLAYSPESGDLWECEFGPLGGDELNVVVPGGNYGWPLVSVGRNYTGQPVSEQPWSRPGIEMPVFAWSPSSNPTSILFYTGDRFPGWKGNLIVSGTTSQLQRMTVKDRRIVGSPRFMLRQLGQRFRLVRQGPDGLLYVLTEMLRPGQEDSHGTVLRIEPAPPAQSLE